MNCDFENVLQRLVPIPIRRTTLGRVPMPIGRSSETAWDENSHRPEKNWERR